MYLIRKAERMQNDELVINNIVAEFEAEITKTKKIMVLHDMVELTNAIQEEIDSENAIYSPAPNSSKQKRINIAELVHNGGFIAQTSLLNIGALIDESDKHNMAQFLEPILFHYITLGYFIKKIDIYNYLFIWTK